MPTLSSDKSLISRSKHDNSSISIQEGPSTKRRRLSHAQDMELDSDSEMAEMATPTMIDNWVSITFTTTSFTSIIIAFIFVCPSWTLASIGPLVGVPLSTDAADAAAASSMTFGDNLSSILPTSHKLKPNINSCINLNLFQVYGTNHLVFSPGSSAVEKF